MTIHGIMEPMGPTLSPTFAFDDLSPDSVPSPAGLSFGPNESSVLAQLSSLVPPEPTDPRIGVDPRTSQPVCTAEALETLENELPSILTAYDSMMADHWQREREIEEAYAMLRPDSRSQGNYPGASRMLSEMMMATVDQTKARIARGLLEVEPMLRVVPIMEGTYANPAILELAKSTERFLDSYGKRVLKIEDLLPLAVLRLCKVGTAVVRADWEKDIAWTGFHTPDGQAQWQPKDDSGVRLRLIRNHDVILWPCWLPDWQRDYEFVGHRSVMTVNQFREFAQRIGLDPELQTQIEEFSRGAGKPTGSTGNTFGDMPSSETAGIDPAGMTSLRGFELPMVTELWGRQSFEPGAPPSLYRIFYHEGLRKVLKIEANPYFSGRHPYFPLRYKLVDGSAWGTGLGQEIFMCHVADTMFRNLEIDNLLSTAFSIVAYKNGTILDQLVDRLAPGQRVPVEDPEGDIKPISFATHGAIEMIYQGQNANENRKVTVSGQAPVLQGQGDPTLKSGGGTGAIVALIDQAGKKFGDVDATIRRGLTELYGFILDLVFQFAPNGLYVEYASEQDAMMLVQTKYQPARGKPASALFEIVAEAPSASNNKEMAKNHLAMIYNFMQQHVQMEIGMAQMVYQAMNPAGFIPFVWKSAEFLNDLARKMLEANDIPGVAAQIAHIEPPTPAEQQVNGLMAQVQQLAAENEALKQQAAGGRGMSPGAGPGGRPAPTGPEPPPPGASQG